MSNGYDLSAASMMDLKAELQKKGLEFKTSRHASSLNSIRSKKKIDEELKKTRPISRQKSSTTRVDVSEDVLEKSRVKLEEKSKLYDRIRYGDVDDVSPELLNNILVDFDRKDWDSEKQMYNLPPKEDAPKVVNNSRKRVFVDEFGRTRTAGMDDTETVYDESVENLISSLKPVDDSQLDDVQNDLHYDDRDEIRAKGVGFYRFSQNESHRQEQMTDLLMMRQNTLASRTQLMVLKEKRKQMKEARLKKVEERKNRHQS